MRKNEEKKMKWKEKRFREKEFVENHFETTAMVWKCYIKKYVWTFSRLHDSINGKNYEISLFENFCCQNLRIHFNAVENLSMEWKDMTVAGLFLLIFFPDIWPQLHPVKVGSAKNMKNLRLVTLFPIKTCLRCYIG